jgi:hypothetical protein
MGQMPKGERDDLMSVVKMRARVAKAAVAQQEAQLLNQVEEELSARFRADDEAWKEITEEARLMVQQANEKIAAICRERGVRDEFAPQLGLDWYGRGSNAMRERRTELRKLAQTRIAAAGKAAKTTIEQKSVEVLTELVAGSLESDQARAFLETIPSPQQLMPPVTVGELEALADNKPKERSW